MKDPAGTRNNPGKLVKGLKYESIFKVNDPNQDYERYKIAYKIYSSVGEICKGDIQLNDDVFEKNTFIHHVVYCLICIKLKKIDYKPDELKLIDSNKISESDITDALNIIVETLTKNQIPKTQIIKQIKNQSFTQKLNLYMATRFRNE